MLKKIFTTIVYIFAVIGFVLVGGYFAVKFGFTNTSGIIDEQRENFLENQTETPEWAKSDEWETLRQAITKDKEVFAEVEKQTDVEARLIVAQLVVEQLRLFYSNRELFKKVFQPLKILGNQSQFSWGIMGLKETTAIEIENHLKDKNSPFYLGEKYESLLDFKTGEHGKERFERITNENDHYFGYLYSALYLKQVSKQWKKAGFDISDKPEILSTLFNIGFANSKPKNNPQAGGAEIEIGEKIYSFGGLAGEFYYSKELQTEFPRK